MCLAATKTRADLAGIFSGVGVELGVASGDYSESILRNPAVTRLYSVDRWGDHHNWAEYQRACNRLSVFGPRSVIVRDTFEGAACGFADASLDFVYIDGYAHTGQESGKTLADWWPKLKPGGVFAGHDYCSQYPATMSAVDAFCAKHDLYLHIISGDALASWATIKPIPPIFTAFYTRGTLYEQEAARLIASLDRLKLPHDVVGVTSMGGWAANSRYTATHVCNMLAKYPDRPVIQLDADAVVLRRPAWFNVCLVTGVDVAAYRLPSGTIANGTIYFAPTDAARAIAADYAQRIADGHHGHDEQRCFADALTAADLAGQARVAWLPASYCYIHDINADDLHGAPVVIEHLQASREQAPNSPALETRRRRIVEVTRA